MSGTQMQISRYARDGKNMKLRALVSSCFALMRAALREIFDEAAYERFLERHALANSRRNYAAFLAESSRQREQRPRCC